MKIILVAMIFGLSLSTSYASVLGEGTAVIDACDSSGCDVIDESDSIEQAKAAAIRNAYKAVVAHCEVRKGRPVTKTYPQKSTCYSSRNSRNEVVRVNCSASIYADCY